jgi:DNA-binding transcriptional MerR regulator
MDGLRIAEVAERTGVPATTLRYYEDIGLLAPAARAGNGYRAYTDRDVDRLRFITSAKQLDLSLDDLRELLVAWDGEDCAGVQERMSSVAAGRLAQAQNRIADLMQLAAQLQVAVQRLSADPQQGGCDDGCACSTATAPAPPVACSLEVGRRQGRVMEWSAVVGRASGRLPLPGGVALTFAHDPELTVELARLAAAEHACCTFFDFDLRVDAAGLRFEVRAPAEAQDAVAAVFGESVPFVPTSDRILPRSLE